MKIKIGQCGALFSLLLLAFNANAQYVTEKSGFVITGYAGINFLETSNTSNLVTNTPSQFQPPNIPEIDFLTGSNDTEVGFVPGIGLGYNFYVAPYTEFQNITLINNILLSVNYFYQNADRDGGVEVFGISPSAFDYDMDINSNALMFNAEIDFPPIWHGTMLFVEGGMGVAINSANYHESTDARDVDLDTHVSTDLAYSLGFGVKSPITDNLFASVRYVYMDMGSASTDGQSQSSPTAFQGSVDSVSTDLRSQMVLFSLSYVIA